MAYNISSLVEWVRGTNLKESTFWSNVGKLLMCAAFYYNVKNHTDTEWLWLCFGGIMTAHEAFTRIVDAKFGATTDAANTPPK